MAALPQQILRQAGHTTSQTVQSVARAVAAQTSETLRTAKEQVGLPQSETLPQQEQELTPALAPQAQPQRETIDRESIAREESAALAELQAKLNQIRARRTQELASYAEAQQAMMDQKNVIAAPTEVAEPQGKIRKAMGQAKKAITSLISNRKQGESKQGSGKG